MEVDSETTTNTTAPQEKKEEKKKNEDHRYKFEFTRAIKENHGRPIVDVAWNPFKDGERYYATVGANQVNIYEMQTRGNFISTLLNYRNWPLKTMKNKYMPIKENFEKNNPELVDQKSFIAVGWMRRWRDFWCVASDNEAQIHIISMVHSQVLKIIKWKCNVVQLLHHPMYPNILCVVDKENTCKFINTLNEVVIYCCPDKICRMRFSPSGDKFIGVLSNGNVREYAQKVEFLKNDDSKVDDDEDDDLDMNTNNKENANENSNRNTDDAKTSDPTNDLEEWYMWQLANRKKKTTDKRLVVTQLNTYKLEDTGSHVADVHYRDEEIIIAGNEDGEFKMVNIATATLMHQWKVAGQIEKGEVCKFDVKGDCVVFGNGAHQVQVYDVEKKKMIRDVHTGRGRRTPITFATFCKNHPQSVVVVGGENTVMKFDPIELVKDYFPSTSDFQTQYRNGIQLFPEVRTVEYDADKVQESDNE